MPAKLEDGLALSAVIETFNQGLRLAGPEAAYVVGQYATYHGWDEQPTRQGEIAKPEKRKRPKPPVSPDALDALVPESRERLRYGAARRGRRPSRV